MRITTAIVLVAIGGFLYAGQIVSVVNLGLAQRLGLQERPDHVDPLFTSLEVWTARWDLVTLIGLPIAGVLMLVDNSWWPYAAMIGGGLAADWGDVRSPSTSGSANTTYAWERPPNAECCLAG